jgi:hypothetical protein
VSVYATVLEIEDVGKGGTFSIRRWKVVVFFAGAWLIRQTGTYNMPAWMNRTQQDCSNY